MPCVACGNSSWRLITEGEDYEYSTRPCPFKIVECSVCKHVYLHPTPDADEIASLYPSTYYTVNDQSPSSIQGFIANVQTKMGVKRTLRFIEGLRVRSIVDVGCGSAARLIRLAEILGSHVEVIGLDLHHQESAIEAARRRAVILKEGNVETDLSALRDGGHDFIFMNQMIEHFRNPLTALQAIYRKVSPGGRILVETPNLGGFDYILFRQKYWGHWHIPRHLHLFTQKSLAQFASRAGFKIIEQGYLPSPGPWILSLRNIIGLNSIRRSRGSVKSLAEFICFRNVPVVGFFTALDLLTIGLGLPTSTQYLVGSKE
jgi:ubiquinone/menaquinone biosynthesis C-methylase UbiE